MNLCGYIPESLNEGYGLRTVVFISGCRHACPGCFNPESWSFRAGEPFTPQRQQEVIRDIMENPLLDGLTLCGGDPFFSAAECSQFVRDFREACPDRTVWAYTGFVYEDLLTDQERQELALLCDVIVDGRFVEQQKDLTLPFRGSRNQRLVDVKASIQAGYTVSLT
ncbi:anaerobic ribonucleoside-triphosphate reductase activating protein [Paenibacillus polymyxa]|uniref:anaerobic ribonucleoside-triphosphate reductase activating protein n=1 Tax=Paenibacillus TaxID=44249 RepID=UPI00077C6E76|nr:anaerobic ribonucleoside-triphosphate reductase activating protein [Paenibacillus polymyxa]KYG94197.1 anaerobic ribonucleoside-triphosphate reductase activating protein [Paenibacillus polymyxa]WGV33001.1 anaerobic ribonucleoside-triphosphate reductase activating protein [Paenibacillus polymyxa]